MSTDCPARANPFRSGRVESLRFRLDASGWRDLMDRFAHLGYRAALVGPKGSGKTTLLEEIESLLERQGWRIRRWRLTRERRAPSAEDWGLAEMSGDRDLVSVDGAEQLSWWSWRRLAKTSRRAGGLLVTSHSPGLLPEIHTHQTSRELFLELVAELLDRSAAETLREELIRLFELHQGDLRECFRSLYDRWPNFRDALTVTPRPAGGRTPPRARRPPGRCAGSAY